MFARSGFLRLVRPATSAISRRGSQAGGIASNASPMISSMRPPVRTVTSSPIMNQSAAATMTSESGPAPGLSTAEPFEPVAQTDNAPPQDSKMIMAEYDSMKGSSVLTLSDYESFLSRLAENRAFDESYKLLEDMRAAGVAPSATTYGYVLKSGRRGLRISEVREIFGQPLPVSGTAAVAEELASEPKRVSYFFERMLEIRDAMEKEGLQLETWFWDDCASWLASINHAGLLINLAIAQETRGISPSVKYYTKMLHTLPRCGFSERADILFSRMVLNGLADCSAYVTRLGALVYMGRYEEAEVLFAELGSKFPLNEVAYNTIIHGYLQAQQFDKATAVFEKMKMNPTAQPNGVTACTFIGYFYESGKLEHANEILAYFKDTIGFPQSSTERSILLKFYGRYDPGQANRLIQELVQADPNFDVQVYNALLGILVDRRVSPDWKRTLGELALDKAYPLKAGGIAELCAALPYHVRHLIGRMEAYSVAPTATTYDLLMRGLLLRKDHSAVIKMYELIEAQPTMSLFSSHRNSYLAALILSGGPKADIEKFLNVMKMRRWPVSSVNSRRLAEISMKVPAGSFVYTKDKANAGRPSEPQ